MFDSPTWWTREKAQIRWQQFQDTRNIVINPTLMEIADCVKEALLPITKYLYKQELE